MKYNSKYGWSPCLFFKNIAVNIGIYHKFVQKDIILMITLLIDLWVNIWRIGVTDSVQIRSLEFTNFSDMVIQITRHL